MSEKQETSVQPSSILPQYNQKIVAFGNSMAEFAILGRFGYDTDEQTLTNKRVNTPTGNYIDFISWDFVTHWMPCPELQ